MTLHLFSILGFSSSRVLLALDAPVIDISAEITQERKTSSNWFLAMLTRCEFFRGMIFLEQICWEFDWKRNTRNREFFKFTFYEIKKREFKCNSLLNNLFTELNFFIKIVSLMTQKINLLEPEELCKTQRFIFSHRLYF